MTTESQTIANLAAAGAPIQNIEPGLYIVSDVNGSQRLLDTRDLGDYPRVKKGNRIVRDVRSLLTYVEKHGLPTTEVWADTERSTVTAVIDAHTGAGGIAGNESHRATLALLHTPEWATWLEHDGVELDQLAFAEHIESNADDVVSPASSYMLEMAQSFQATTGVEFKSGQRLDTGETAIHYEETTTARAGKGDLTIPAEFKIAVKPYVGGTTYGIMARFRYRIVGSSVRFKYILDRPHAVLEAAFADIVKELRAGVPAWTPDETKGETGTPLPAVEGLSVPVVYGKTAS